MTGDTCDRTCSNKHNRNFVVATAALVAVTFCCHSSLLFCFVLNNTSDIFQQKETLYFGYTNLGSSVQFQIVRTVARAN